MHSASWQAVCGFFTDVYESLDREDITLRHIFEAMCQHDAERYALWVENGKKRQLTYGEMPGLCAGAAQQLDVLVAAPRGVVALHMANSAMWPVIFWAILMSGRTPLLLNAAVPLKAFEKVLAAVNAAAVISSDTESEAIRPEQLLDGSQEADIAVYEDRWADQVIFMTSGTSGVPKLLVYNGKCMARQIQSCRYFYRETTELAYPRSNGQLRQLALLPFSHIFGFIILVMWYPYFGRQIVYPHSLRPDDVINTCQKLKVTHLCAVPSYFDMIARLMTHAAKGLLGKYAEDFIAYLRTGRLPAPEMYQRYQGFAQKLCAYTLGGNMRYLISGGGMLSSSTAAFFNRLGLYFCNGYGMTELGILAVERSDSAEKRMQTSIGTPSYGAEFSIDETGQLLVDCSYAAVGYLGKEGVCPLERPFPTNDLARRLPDGRYMLLGRNDDIIIDRDGNRIHPHEIEENLRPIRGVKDVCVASCGGKLVAFFENSGRGDVQIIAEAVERANRTAPVAHHVHEAWLVKSLQRTSKGEPSRKRMAEAWQAGLTDAVLITISLPDGTAEQSSPVAEAVRCKVAELLSIPEKDVLPNANFFTELGMDSLGYMCLMQWLEEEYGIPAMTPDQERYETVYQCVQMIQKQGGRSK